MGTNTAGLIALNFLCATLCWLPTIIVPNLDLPAWLPLICVGLSAALSGFLNRQRWPVFVISAAIGSLVGFCIGYAIWWPRDPIAGPWVPVVVTIGTVAAAVIALISAFAGSRLSVPGERARKTAWFALLATAAFGPTCLALTPPLVARRVAQNERLAAKRLTSLQRAVERTVAASASPGRLCDGSVLARNYSGLPFSDEDWRRITGNYVKQDGFVFMIYCQEQAGYVIDAHPARDGEDGTRRFCVDESGKLGCGTKWNRSRNACVPCR
jgi:hypothetical protein